MRGVGIQVPSAGMGGCVLSGIVSLRAAVLPARRQQVILGAGNFPMRILHVIKTPLTTGKSRGGRLTVPARWVLLAGLALACGPAGAAEGVKASPIPVVEIPGQGDPNGELALCDYSGKVARRYTGLGHPVHLIRSGTDTFFVTDRTGGRILELDLEGRVHWTWKGPPNLHSLSSVLPTPRGTLFVVTEHQGFFEIDRDGNLLRQVPDPLEIRKPINSAVPLPDGSVLIVARDRKEPFFHLKPEDSKALLVPLPFDESHCNMPHAMPWTPDGRELVLWDNDWTKTYLVRWTGEGIETTGTLPLPHRLVEVAPDGRGGCAFVLEALRTGVWSPGSQIQQFYTAFQPSGIAVFPDRERVLIAYRRLEDGAWPDSRPAVAPGSHIDQRCFWLWIAGAVFLSVLLHLLAWWWEGHPNAVKTAEKAGPDPSSDGGDTPKKPDSSPPITGRRGFFLALGTFLAAVGGVLLAAHGYRLMQAKLTEGWSAYFVGGAALAAVALESWRRLGLRQKDPFWSATLRIRPKLRGWPGMLIGCLVALSGSLLFCSGYVRGWEYSNRVGLWGSLIFLLVAMSFMPIQSLRRWKTEFSRTDALFIVIPLVTAGVTFGYRLGDLPRNIHMDSVGYTLVGVGLREGWLKGIWDSSLYPWPVIGHLPEAIGTYLVGFCPAGLRLGSVVFCLTGIPAVYLLGRAYRDRKVGVLAALLLAGSTPFIHFTRVTYPAEAATLGLWVITFFALAIRHGHPGLWILAGLAGGWCFFVYPVARVAPMSAFLFGIVIAFRAPRKVTLPRWFGPLVMALAALVVLAPVLPTWVGRTAGPFPRVQEAVQVYKPGEGIDWDFVKHSFGKPFLNSFGWFFTVPDRSGQGSLSPACNPAESVVLAVGLGIALIEGFSLNVLLVGYLVLNIILCGAWAYTSPFYIRLLPSATVGVLLMARCLDGFLGFLERTPKWLRTGFLSLAIVGVIALSPVANFRRYVRYEGGENGRPTWEMTAIGRRLKELGPAYDYYMVITGRAHWSADFSWAKGHVLEQLPYIWNLRVKEVRDLPARLPFPTEKPIGVIVQGARADQDVPLLKEWYPNARVEEIRGGRDQLFAVLVLIEKKEDI